MGVFPKKMKIDNVIPLSKNGDPENFSKPKLKLTKTKYRISIRGPAIWNDFVEDCLKSIEKTPFFKVKMKSKLLNFNNEISYF